MMVIDSVSKITHLVPTHTMVTAEGAVQLFLHNVWKLHSLPKHVVSDRGMQFVSQFTQELYCLLGVQVAASMAWYPQLDRQTEHVNQELDQFL